MKDKDHLKQIDYSTRNPVKTQGEEIAPFIIGFTLFIVGVLVWSWLSWLLWVGAILFLAHFVPRRPL